MILLSMGSLQSFMQLIGVLIIFVFVLALTWLTTKWIANYQKGQAHNKNLQLVETLRIGNNKYVQIVKAGEEYLVIGAGKDEVTLLATLTEEQLHDLSENGTFPDGTQTGESFHDVLDRVKKHLPKKQA